MSGPGKVHGFILPMPDEFSQEDRARLARNVSYLRGLLGLSMRDLRERSGVSPSTISRIERGYGTSVSTASKIAAGLGMSLPSLLETIFEADRAITERRKAS